MRRSLSSHRQRLPPTSVLAAITEPWAELPLRESTATGEGRPAGEAAQETAQTFPVNGPCAHPPVGLPTPLCPTALVSPADSTLMTEEGQRRRKERAALTMASPTPLSAGRPRSAPSLTPPRVLPPCFAKVSHQPRATSSTSSRLSSMRPGPCSPLHALQSWRPRPQLPSVAPSLTPLVLLPSPDAPQSPPRRPLRLRVLLPPLPYSLSTLRSRCRLVPSSMALRLPI